MGQIVAASPHSVDETIERLTASLGRRHVKVFARIDHGGAARDAGLELGAEEVLVFGDPGVGTILMQSDRRIGLELPLRILVWEQDGTTRVGYRSPQDLATLYDVESHRNVLAGMANLLAQLVSEATQS